MSRSFRIWLARKLAPVEFDDLERLCYMRAQVAELYRWCGEFPDLNAGIEWLYAGYRARYGVGGDPSRPSPWRYGISDFREQLRQRRDGTA